MIKKLLFALSVPILSPILWCLLDFLLRKSNGDIHTGGFPDDVNSVVFFAIPFLTLIVLFIALWKNSPALAIISSCLGAILTYWYVWLVFLIYICGAGIDCI